MYSLWCVVVGDTALFSSLCLCFFFPCVVGARLFVVIRKKIKTDLTLHGLREALAC